MTLTFEVQRASNSKKIPTKTSLAKYAEATLDGRLADAAPGCGVPLLPVG